MQEFLCRPVFLTACRSTTDRAAEEYDVIFYLDSDMLAVGDVAGLLDFLPEEGQPAAQRHRGWEATSVPMPRVRFEVGCRAFLRVLAVGILHLHLGAERRPLKMPQGSIETSPSLGRGLYVNAGLLCFRPSMLELGKMREALANWTFSEPLCPNRPAGAPQLPLLFVAHFNGISISLL